MTKDYTKLIDLKKRNIYLEESQSYQSIYVTMSEDLNNFLHQRTLKNKKITKPLVWISLTVGCNIKRITGFRDPIKL